MKNLNRRQVTTDDAHILAIRIIEIQSSGLQKRAKVLNMNKLSVEYAYRNPAAMLASIRSCARTRNQTVDAFYKAAMARRGELIKEPSPEKFESSPSGISHKMLLSRPWTTASLEVAKHE